MAVLSLCSTLLSGQNAVCQPLKRRYFQQAVVIPKNDILSYTIEKTDPTQANPTCKYSVKFKLKPSKKGLRFLGSENGSSYFGTFDKSVSDLGFVQYKHNVNMLVVGATEEAKCILEALDKGRFVVALQFTDGTIEIYGIENGLSSVDYTYDVQGGGGGTAIVLSSSENTPENYIPLVYKPQTGTDGTADFDAGFSN